MSEKDNRYTENNDRYTEDNDRYTEDNKYIAEDNNHNSANILSTTAKKKVICYANNLYICYYD